MGIELYDLVKCPDGKVRIVSNIVNQGSEAYFSRAIVDKKGNFQHNIPIKDLLLVSKDKDARISLVKRHAQNRFKRNLKQIPYNLFNVFRFKMLKLEHCMGQLSGMDKIIYFPKLKKKLSPAEILLFQLFLNKSSFIDFLKICPQLASIFEKEGRFKD